jgi:diguanylate cyclase (GGDEF)-like protein
MERASHRRSTAIQAELIDGGPSLATFTDPIYDYWVRHIRTGFGVFLAETLAVMAYLAWTPHGSHRRLLWLVAVSWLIVGLASLWSAPWVAANRWRAAYSVAWTVLSAFAVGGMASLDTGFDSPLLVLLFLPLAYAALIFTPRAAALCGLSGLAAATLVTIADTGMGKSEQDALMFFASLTGVALLSVAASVNRTRLEQHEKWLMAAIVEMAEVDGLTGCAVPRVFRRRTEQETARSTRNDRPLSLLMIDVDKFKSVNDTFGHPVGDRVLATVGAVLRSNTRSFDLAGRLGGDEFAVLAPDTDPSSAVALAERIRGDLARSAEVPVTLSIGISRIDQSEPTTERLLSDADLALYEVKRAGGDAVGIQHPGIVAPLLLRDKEGRGVAP